MRLPLQVSAVLSAIVLSFCTAPVSAFTFTLPTTPTKWELGPNNASKGPFGTPGSATWSVMGSGLNDVDGMSLPGNDFHIGVTTDFTTLLTAGDELAMINEAVGLWDSVSGFTNLGMVTDGGGGFGAATSAGGQLGDIRIGAMAIDLPGHLLGHAFQPGTEALLGPRGTIFGDIHLDNSEPWIDDPKAPSTSSANFKGYDLFTVLLHEFGHALGLGHSSDSNLDTCASVMCASYSGARRALSADDIAGIQYLYGPPPDTGAPVPEPGTLTLLGLGLAGLVAGVRLTKRAANGAPYTH